MSLGRYVRITFTSNWGDQTYTAAERIFACDADGVKWNDETMPHTVSSGYQGDDGRYASDTTTNVWYSLVADLPVWWKVDLGEIRGIVKVKLKGNESMIDRTPKDFTVSVSDDDINWTDVLSGQTLYNTDEQTFDVTGPPPTTLSITELEAYGYITTGDFSSIEVDESLILDDSPDFIGGLQSFVLDDGILMGEDLVCGWELTADDDLALTDSMSNILTALINEWISLIDAQTNNWNGTETIPDALSLQDIVGLGQIFLDTIDEPVALDDAVSYKLTITILEYLGFTDLVNTMMASSYFLNDSLVATDSSNDAFSLVISEMLSTIDAVSVMATFINAISESIGLAEATSLINNIGFSINDPLVFTESVASKGHFYSIIHDTLAMDCAIELNGEIWECYVLNTPKFHPSVYSGFNFNSYCVFENRAFAANDTGVFELTGDTDNGNTIHNGVILSATNFGSPNYKRFRKGYLGISGTAPVMVFETEDGTKKVFNIDAKGMVVASSDLKSKRWKLSLADFETLDEIKLIPVLLVK